MVKVIVDARNVDVVVLVQEKVALTVKIHSEIKVILIFVGFSMLYYYICIIFQVDQVQIFENIYKDVWEK